MFLLLLTTHDPDLSIKGFNAKELSLISSWNMCLTDSSISLDCALNQCTLINFIQKKHITRYRNQKKSYK